MLVLKNLAFGFLVLFLAACGAPRPRHAVPQNESAPVAAPAAPLPAAAYRIDASRSELRILVYRAGALARFGHNHVLVNRSIQGSVNLANPASASQFRLSVPAAAFVVDDAQMRREEGADFAAEVPEDAKSGTLRNMLSSGVLDAGPFPTITVASIERHTAQQPADAGPMVATVMVEVAGHESTIAVPVTIEQDSSHLSAAGSFEIRQSALGLTPYSLMLGALQVQDAITIKFRIIASPG
jgi:hypothetical protein